MLHVCSVYFLRVPHESQRCQADSVIQSQQTTNENIAPDTNTGVQDFAENKLGGQEADVSTEDSGEKEIVPSTTDESLSSVMEHPERLEIRRLKVNATCLHSDSVHYNEKGMQPKPAFNQKINSEIPSSESEEASQIQCCVQTADKTVQTISNWNRESTTCNEVSNEQHFIKITNIETVTHTSSSEDSSELIHQVQSDKNLYHEGAKGSAFEAICMRNSAKYTCTAQHSTKFNSYHGHKER